MRNATVFRNIFVLLLGIIIVLTCFAVSNIEIDSAYVNDPETCPHNGIDRTKYDYPADCSNHAHRDTVCTKCGKVLESQKTGNVLGEHIFDYEDLISIEDSALTSSSSCRTYMYPIQAKFRCKVCGETVRVLISYNYMNTAGFHGLEYHKNLNTSVKNCEDPAEPFTYHCDDCNQDVVCLIQSERPYPKLDTPDNPDNPDKPEDPDNPDTPHVHDLFVKNQINPTCTTKGLIQYACTGCSYVMSDYIDELGHNYGPYVVTVASTCNKEGVQTSTCSRCGSIQTQPIPMTSHEFSSTPRLVIDATCSKEGVKLFNCLHCSEMRVEILPLNADNHRYESDWTVSIEGTCSIHKVITNTCADCGKNVSKTGDLGEHKYVVVDRKDATCTSDGYIKYSCEYCLDNKTEVIESSGHKFVENKDTNGNIINVCTGCKMQVTNTVSNNKVVRSIALGALRIDISDQSLIYKDPSSIDVMITKITSDDPSYSTHTQYLNILNASSSSSYKIQDAIKVTLLVDGEEYAINSQMTLYWYLDDELSNAKLTTIYYPNEGGTTSVSVMKNSTIKKLVVTIPGAEYEKSNDGVIILGINGDPIETSGNATASLGQINNNTPSDPGKTPTTPSGNTTTIILIVIGIIVLLGVGAALIVVLGKKNKMDI